MEQENENVQVADAVAEPSVVQELGGKNVEEGENCTGASEEVQLSKQVTPTSLKARPKVVKNAAASSSRKGKKGKGAQSVRRKFGKKRGEEVKGEEVKGEEEGVNDGSEEARDGNLRKEDVNNGSEEAEGGNLRKEDGQEKETVLNVEGAENGMEKKNKEENEERIAMETSELGKDKQVGEERIAGESKGKAKQGSDSKNGRVDKDSRNEKDKGKVGAKGKNEKNKGKVEEEKNEMNKAKVEAKEKNEKNKEMIEAKRKRGRDDKKKEKLGGLIFMCSAKTKPDCFRYRVMGVTVNKKDAVLAVKPGLKLFLYDFDLKLMYGIYEASSRGGMKLEPKAFGGSFPAQVRFRVYKDCYPIPESDFKKAIKENYDRKNKFNTELTVRQVRKLSVLFRSAASQSIQPTAVPAPSSSTTTVRGRERFGRQREPHVHPDRENFLKASPHVHPERETFLGASPHVNSERESFLRASHEIRRLPVRSHDRHERVNYAEGSTQREEILHDLFMSEREYRTYGLQGERRNLTSPKQMTSALDPYNRDQEREHLIRQVDPRYRDAVSVQREAVTGPLYLSQRDLQVYNTGGRGELLAVAPPVSASAAVSSVNALDSYTRDPHYSYHHGLSSSTYLPPVRRDELSAGSYFVDSGNSYLVNAGSLRRGETDQVNRLYSSYGADSLSSYNPAHGYRPANVETTLPPVSSRYSFGDPSITYR